MLNYFVWGFMGLAILVTLAVAGFLIRDMIREDKDALRRD